MANQHYGFSSYGGGGGGGGTGTGTGSSSLYSGRSLTAASLFGDASFNGTSRYLSGELLPSSTISSSLLYHPEYSAKIPGITTPTHSYGPPGVDGGMTVVSADSLYSGLKRRPIESLYHQTPLGIQNEIGLTEAWYSTNHLAKLPRYENTSHLPIYPQRLGEKDCDYYMQTRTCKFGDSCKFHHPIWVPEGGVPNWNEVPPTSSESLPERPLQPDCPYFLKTQTCKFGNRCRFNHPKDRITQQGNIEDGTALPERPSEPPCAFYMKTGKCKFGSTCKFHHPKGVCIQPGGDENGTHNVPGDAILVQPPVAPAWVHNSKGLPIRMGEEDCPFYVKTGSCKYGAACRYNHPERYAAVTPTLSAAPLTHVRISVPTASLLPSLDERIAQAMVYPQRPGQSECDYYMKTGLCKFGSNCKFDHPLNRRTPNLSATEYQVESLKLTLAGLPRREGATHCPFYMKTGTCKYGPMCKFDHPPPGEVMAMATLQHSSGAGEDAA